MAGCHASCFTRSGSPRGTGCPSVRERYRAAAGDGRSGGRLWTGHPDPAAGGVTTGRHGSRADVVTLDRAGHTNDRPKRRRRAEPFAEAALSPHTSCHNVRQM